MLVKQYWKVLAPRIFTQESAGMVCNGLDPECQAGPGYSTGFVDNKYFNDREDVSGWGGAPHPKKQIVPKNRLIKSKLRQRTQFSTRCRKTHQAISLIFSYSRVKKLCSTLDLKS